MPTDTATMAELRATLEELNVLVKALRDKAAESESNAEALIEARVTGLDQKIADLRAKQTELELKLKAPATTGSDAEKSMVREKEARAVLRSYLRGPEVWASVPPEKRALVADQATGQIMIPAEMESELVRALPAKAVIRGLVGAKPIGSDKMHRRSLTGVTVAWGKLELGASLPESTMKPGDEYLYVRDIIGSTWVGRDMLEDTDIDLPAEINTAFADAIAPAEDDGFLNGDYSGGLEPEGILTRVGTASYQIPAVPVTESKQVSFADLITLAYAVPEQYRVGGTFLMNPSTELFLMLEQSGDGKYLWQPSVQAGVPARIYGYPTMTSQFMPTLPADGATSGTVYALFGDFRSGYAIRDRRGVSVQRLVELRAEAGLVGFLITKRVLGGVIRPNAFAALWEPFPED